MKIERRDISQDLFDTFTLMEQYAAAAYCPDNNDSPDTKLTCATENCPLVQAANTTTVSEFENSLITDVTGFVATDSTNNLIVVSFRGSGSVRNYLTDLSFPLVDASDICAGCHAFGGFYTAWTEARKGVLAAVEAAADANPSYKIVSVGHSLGGAVAVFAAAQLRNDGYDVELYTFGQPRIGSSKISSYITDQGSNFRITHKADPVPKLPPVLLGFVHISPEYYITVGNDEAVTLDSVEGPLEGSVNWSGNTGNLKIDFDAHGWYFGNISVCRPDVFEFKKRGVYRGRMVL
ncbi:Lipase class 3 [Macrophomina phaseolina MS6]|uniref:Lipase class 3 n=1 Tax=Macrophomina phaseolina (strain MS6) TaxID=1126212 RepID=K2QKA1_MACPH|nr:Lipase class 3 [Macrophomina phaseolina MS6]